MIVDTATPDTSGDFSIKIVVGGSQWKENGFYEIQIWQGSQSDGLTTSVKIDNGNAKRFSKTISTLGPEAASTPKPETKSATSARN